MDKKKILIIAIATIIIPILLFVVTIAVKAIILKTSYDYQSLVEESLRYDESGHIKGFDPSGYDISWYEDVVNMSDEEFYRWYFDRVLKDDTDLTLEQYIVVRFAWLSPDRDNSTEYETEFDEYEAALEYATDKDLQVYNERFGYNYSSIEEAMYAKLSETRYNYVQYAIAYSDYVISFAEKYDDQRNIQFACAHDILANYYGYEITDEEIDFIIEDYIGDSSFLDRIVLRYFCKRELRGLFAGNIGWLSKISTRIHEDFSKS